MLQWGRFLAPVLFLFVFQLIEGASAAEPSKTPSKIPDIIQQQIDQQTFSFESSFPEGASSDDQVEMIHLVFHAAGTISAREAADLEALGAEIISQTDPSAELPAGIKLPEAWMIEVWIPLDQVETAAALDWVVAVTPHDPGAADPHPTNPTNSEGVALHNADQLQLQGVTGAGVNVGVVSDGVTNLATAQLNNELPAVNVLAAGNGDEGTAMLEIVHDMAPGAGLLFNATGGSVATHVNALMNLVANGAHVIAEDWAFDSQPAFQQGFAAASAEAIAAAGVPIHSSAGNRGRNHAARVTATGTGQGPDGFNGPFVGCPFLNSNTVAIAPVGDTTFDLVLGNSSSFTLQWSEPRSIFPTAGQGGFTDLDLYIMDATGTTCLATSTTIQGFGGGDTIEQITVAGLAGTPAKVVVNVFGSFGAAAVPTLDLRWRGTQSQTDVPTRAGSLNPDSNYTGLATSTAAQDVTNNNNIANSSSGGPVQLGLTTLGNGSPGPGLTTTPAPTWTAATGVQISGVGGFGRNTPVCPAVNPGDCRFFGTSASAPHAAACDALVRDAFNNAAAPVAFTNAQLASTAVDIAPAGPDNVSGAGQLDCLAAAGAPTAICQDVTVPTDAGVCTATGVSIDNGSFDPEGGPLTLAQSPAEPYPLGDTQVQLTATDPQGLSDSCSAKVTVVDQEPPQLLCNAPATIVPPDAEISFTATATDNCSVITPVVTAYDCFTFTKKGRRIDKTKSCVVSFVDDTVTISDSGGVGNNIEWTITADDGNGNMMTETCSLTIENPGKGNN
jgi:hypothetical protein